MMLSNSLLESEAFSGMNMSAGRDRDVASSLVTDVPVTADLQGTAKSPAVWSCPIMHTTFVCFGYFYVSVLVDKNCSCEISSLCLQLATLAIVYGVVVLLLTMLVELYMSCALSDELWLSLMRAPVEY